MNAAALQARARRLKALIDGMSREADALRYDPGDMTAEESWRYLIALVKARDNFHDAKAAVQAAANRLKAGRVGHRHGQSP